MGGLVKPAPHHAPYSRVAALLGSGNSCCEVSGTKKTSSVGCAALVRETPPESVAGHRVSQRISMKEEIFVTPTPKFRPWDSNMPLIGSLLSGLGVTKIGQYTRAGVTLTRTGCLPIGNSKSNGSAYNIKRNLGL